MNTTTQLERVTIKGTEYEVLASSTPDDEEFQGRVRIAAAWRRMSIKRQMYLVRPNGAKVFSVFEYTLGMFSSPKSMYFSLSESEKREFVLDAQKAKVTR